jgi:hypothetical protein
MALERGEEAHHELEAAGWTLEEDEGAWRIWRKPDGIFLYAEEVALGLIQGREEKRI